MSAGESWILAVVVIIAVILARITYRRGQVRGGLDSRQHLFAIIDQTPCGIVLLDCDLKLIHCNARASKVLPTIATELPQPLRELAESSMVSGKVTGGPTIATVDSRWRVTVYPPKGGPLGDIIVVAMEPDSPPSAVDGAPEYSIPLDHARQLSGQLILAQEAERTRIARQLHDDVNQDLATLAIHLSSLKRRIPPTLPECQSEVEYLQKAAVQVSEDIRTLSHDLHPGVLRHVGLSPALRGHCVEFARGHQIDVRYTDTAGSIQLPEAIQLCLYRVAQEAMRNVIRHAQATRVEVTLSRGPNTLELRIVDNGRGFDPGSPSAAKGLGLLSMDERVRLIGGRILLQAKPGHGTDLCVAITLPGGTYAEDYAIARG